jgi:hypothetical protein
MASGEGNVYMRVLLRSTRNRSYIQAEHKWTYDQSSARDFGSTVNAIRFSVQQNLENVEVLVTLGDSLYDVTFPLPSPSSRVKPPFR